MNPEVKTKWLEALRSGEYAQTTGALEKIPATFADGSPGGLCCWGVLCRIAESEGVVQHTLGGSTILYDGEDSFPPPSVQSWADLDPFTKYFLDPLDKHVSLADLNDGYKYTFNEIAEVIEEQL